MNDKIDEYKQALSDYLKLSSQETSIKVKVRNARDKVTRIRDEMRAMERELMEPVYEQKS